MLEELGDRLRVLIALGNDLSFCVLRHVRNILLRIIKDLVSGRIGYICMVNTFCSGDLMGVAVWDGKCLW